MFTTVFKVVTCAFYGVMAIGLVLSMIALL